MTHLSLYLCFLLQRFHLVLPVYIGVERNASKSNCSKDSSVNTRSLITSFGSVQWEPFSLAQV